MKATLLHPHGGPEMLHCADFSTPEPGPGEALIRLEAAAQTRLQSGRQLGKITLAIP